MPPQPAPPTAAVRVVEGCDASEARAIVATCEAPVVFRGMIEGWPARQWTPTRLAAEYGDVRTLFRVHRRLGREDAAAPGGTAAAAAPC